LSPLEHGGSLSQFAIKRKRQTVGQERRRPGSFGMDSDPDMPVGAFLSLDLRVSSL
jgi:hypothetical protein